MELLYWIIGFSLIGGVLSVAVAASFLLLSDKVHKRVLPHLVSFAIGTLLAAALLGLIPHAIAFVPAIEPHKIGLTLLLGLLSFFILEKAVLWRHCHHHDDHLANPKENKQTPQNKTTATGTLILIGDTIHNCVDGVLIAAAFITDIHLGIVTALAIAAHEIPQELGDFIILLHSGFSRKKALFYNIVSSLSTLIGAVLAYFALADMQHLLPYILIIAAASFIYIAVADLIPSLHHKVQPIETIQQLLLIASGIAFIFITHGTLH